MLFRSHVSVHKQHTSYLLWPLSHQAPIIVENLEITLTKSGLPIGGDLFGHHLVHTSNAICYILSCLLCLQESNISLVRQLCDIIFRWWCTAFPCPFFLFQGCLSSQLAHLWYSAPFWTPVSQAQPTSKENKVVPWLFQFFKGKKGPNRGIKAQSFTQGVLGLGWPNPMSL